MMRRLSLINTKHIFTLLLLFGVAMSCLNLKAQTSDTTKLIYPIPYDDGNPFNHDKNQSGFYLKEPDNITREIVYDPITGQYTFYSKIGDFMYREPQSMSHDVYAKYQNEKSKKEYWKERREATGSNTGNGNQLIPTIYVGGKAFDKIFGSNTIDIKLQGSADVTFGIKNQKRNDPSKPARLQSVTNFDFDENIQLSAAAKIGEKIVNCFDGEHSRETLKTWADKGILKCPACGKEYAGLFIRLAGVYFAVSIIQLVLGNNSSVSDAMTYYNSDGTFGKQGVGLFVKLFIILGALTFAKQLPKFIEEILGFKLSGGDGFNLKKRLGGMAGLGVAKTLGAGALGFAGGMAANALAAKGNWKGQGLKNGFKNVGSILGGGFSAGARGMTSKEKSMWKSAGGGIKGSVDARNLRDKRGSLGQGGVKGFVTRRADDINRFAGNKTRLDYLEDDLKKLQYGPAGLQDLQDDLFNKQLIASQYNDFQYLKDANGVAFDSNWEADLRNHFGSMVDSSGNPMFSESEINDIVVGAITATGVSNDTATAYLKRLNEKKAADATVRSAQAAVQKQQGAIRDKNIEIDNQKKADAVNKKQ